MAKITLNDEAQEVTLPLSLTELIKANSATPEMVSAQLNGEFVAREQYDAIAIREGDEVDILYFMGGGQSS
ncbi:MAG: sulfur carrier protein ThiS [Bacteroidales bacterium]|jgi:sulfur carrier protein|nr:sulfur carrier protein ThiS [Bacteroidales bacterium]